MKELVLGNLEQKILSIIWKYKEPICVRSVLGFLKGEYAYTTVMTVMNRMEKKGILKKTQEKNYFVYTSTLSKKDYADQHLDCIFKCIVDTYGELAITHFVDTIKKDDTNIKVLKDSLNKPN